MAKKKRRKEFKPRPQEESIKRRGKFKINTGWLILGLAIVVFLLFANTLMPNHYIGRQPQHSDQHIAGYMFKNFAKETILDEGSFPLWNPYIFGGLPYVDAMHGDIFYITMLLRFILPIGTVMALLFVIHIIAAGIGMMLFLREIGIKKTVSFVGAVTYMFTGVIVSFVLAGHDSKVVVTSLLPWAMLFIHRGFRLGKLLDFALLGLVFGLGLISPNVQMMYYAFLACGFYVLYRMYIAWKDAKKPWSVFKPFLLSIGSVAAGIGISAAQMLPGISYLGFSPRAAGGRGWDFATSWSLPRTELIDLLNPRFSGILQNYWGANAFKFHAEYFGVIIVALAIVGLILAWRRRETKFFAGFGIFGLLMALGGNTPFYYIPYYVFPLVKSFRAPAMIFYTVTFSAVVLGALGLQQTLTSPAQPVKKPKSKARKVDPTFVIFSSLAGVLLILALWSSASPQGFASGLVGSIQRTSRKALSLDPLDAKTERMAREVGDGMVQLGLNPPYDPRQIEPQMNMVYSQVLSRHEYSQFNPPSPSAISYLSRVGSLSMALGRNMKNLSLGFWLSLAFVAAGFVLILLWRRFDRLKWLWALLLAGVVFLDLWSVDRHFVGVVKDAAGNPVSPQEFYAKDEVVEFLQKDQGIYRVLPLESRTVGPLYIGPSYRQNNADYLMLYGIQSAGGYHGNQLGRYQEFIGSPGTIMFRDAQNLRYPAFLAALDVKYLIGLRLPGPEDFERLSPQDQQTLYAIYSDLAPWLDTTTSSFRPVFAGQRYVIYRNYGQHSRAWLCANVEVIGENEAILTRMKRVNFDPLKTVILEEKPEGWRPSADPSDTTSPGQVQITRYEPNVIEIAADVKRPAVLVLSENWYPYYRAWVDGSERKVYRADYTLRAVVLEPGNHQVVFRFRSPYVTAGVWITIVALGLVGLAVALSLIANRKKRKES